MSRRSPLVLAPLVSFVSFLGSGVLPAQEPPYLPIAEVPYEIGSGWRLVTWSQWWVNLSGYDADRNENGAFAFRVFPGQNATLTLVDTGWNNESFNVYKNDVYETWMGWQTAKENGNVYDPAWVATPDQAMQMRNFSKGTWTLPPGTYALRFGKGGSPENRYDDIAAKTHHAYFKVDITETPDGDGDRLADQFETNTGVYVSPVNTGTDPTKADTDGDGLDDRHEVFVTLTNPVKKDTDGDGHADGAEVGAGKDPLDPGSKPATIDIATAVEVTIHTEIGKDYQIEWSEDLVTWTAYPEVFNGDGHPVTRFHSTKGKARRYFRAAVVTPTPPP